MEQYKEFAHVYDELISSDIDYNKYSEAIHNICDVMNVNKDAYLDLACGTGNLTLLVAKPFKAAWGVDLSSEMLSVAEEKNRANSAKIKYICQNICNLKLNKKFNLITCCLDSTNYILEDELLLSYFTSVHDHLSEDGLFIFDINSHYKLTEILGDNVFNYDENDVVYIWENNLEDEIVDMYLTFFVKQGELYRRFDEHHTERAYQTDFIEKCLNQCGLKVVKLLDNYEDVEIKYDAERITFVVRKM